MMYIPVDYAESLASHF